MAKLSYDDIKHLIIDALDVDETEIVGELSQDTIEVWDSLAQLTILEALDQASGGAVSKVNGIADAESFDSIFELLRASDIAE